MGGSSRFSKRQNEECHYFTVLLFAIINYCIPPIWISVWMMKTRTNESASKISDASLHLIIIQKKKRSTCKVSVKLDEWQAAKAEYTHSVRCCAAYSNKLTKTQTEQHNTRVLKSATKAQIPCL